MSDCNGCASQSLYNGCCIISISQQKNCPCRDCLIKGMCIEGCEEFKEYENHWITNNKKMGNFSVSKRV